MKIVKEGQTNSDESWERKTLEKLLMQVYKEQRSARIWAWVRRIFWVIILLWILLGWVSTRSQMLNNSEEHTAVIRLEGVISDYNSITEKLVKGMEKAYENHQVKGIIINANSPGGSPVISDVTYGEIRRLKAQHPDIPVYLVANDVCASGCYYIAAAADKIYANPASLVGSIGVIGGGFGFTELMNKIGVERRMKTAGSNKGMGDPFLPETPEQQAIWQTMLDDIHGQFINAVKEGRGKALLWQDNPDIFSGRVYTGNQAKQLGVIDDFGSVYSVSRDIIKAEKMVDYTPEDDFSQTLSRRLGAEVKAGLDNLSTRIW